MKKIKQLKKDAKACYRRATEILAKDRDELIKQIETMNIVTFSNDNPYIFKPENEPVYRNLFFFTYEDHYAGNGSTWMYAGVDAAKSMRPHRLMYDRGYIRGAAVDLHTYRTLAHIKGLQSIDNAHHVSLPRWKEHKNKGAKWAIVEGIMRDLRGRLLADANALKDELTNIIKERYGMSLPYYVMPIW
jgi:hypothetical protein